MRFIKSFLDLLVLNPDGVSDKRAILLGKKCKISELETRTQLRQLQNSNFIIQTKEEGKERVWKIRKPSKRRRAGNKNDVT